MVIARYIFSIFFMTMLAEHIPSRFGGNALRFSREVDGTWDASRIVEVSITSIISDPKIDFRWYKLVDIRLNMDILVSVALAMNSKCIFGLWT